MRAAYIVWGYTGDKAHFRWPWKNSSRKSLTCNMIRHWFSPLKRAAPRPCSLTTLTVLLSFGHIALVCTQSKFYLFLSRIYRVRAQSCHAKVPINMTEPSDLSNDASVAQTIPQTPPRRKLNLLDIHPLELAQQISLLEHDLCKDVLITDIETRRANGPVQGQEDSITPCIKFSNHVSVPGNSFIVI